MRLSLGIDVFLTLHVLVELKQMFVHIIYLYKNYTFVFRGRIIALYSFISICAKIMYRLQNKTLSLTLFIFTIWL